jgi:phosphatidylglycerol lysyltransferase
MASVIAPHSVARASLRTARSSFRQTTWVRNHARAAKSAAAAREQRLELVRNYGDFSLAYGTAVQSGMKYFGDERGYIAYDSRLGYTFVLGDPVAAAEDRQRLIRQFASQHPRLAFCQISPSTAQIVRQLGFYVNEMGVDTIIPLAEYDFRGQGKQWLRTAESWTSRRGYTTREATMNRADVKKINSVSLAWRKTRTVKKKEVRFLNRPFVAAEEIGTRRFYFFDVHQRLLAFVFFDPIYRDGKLIGYVACSKRRHPDAPTYAEPAIMKHAIEVFQQEGCQELRLGLSPLASIEDRDFRASWLLHKLFRYGFSSWLINRCIYNVQGHADYKRRYRGREEKVYFATKSAFDPVQLAALVKTCKIL